MRALSVLVHTPADDTTCRLCLNVLHTLSVNTSATGHTNIETRESTLQQHFSVKVTRVSLFCGRHYGEPPIRHGRLVFNYLPIPTFSIKRNFHHLVGKRRLKFGDELVCESVFS